jgi:arabinose-5-phosphate isomerase
MPKPSNVIAFRGRRAGALAPVERARAVFRQQAEAIARLADRVNDDFAHAVEAIYRTRGHIVVIGVGKSGLVGKKIAATLASTGTPAIFVHAAEAHHGDLGMLTERDTALLISYSGETQEVVTLLPHLVRLGVPMIGIMGDTRSTLARGVDVSLDVSVEREACPNGLAPTNSTLATMAMGDALAVSLIQRREFGVDDFARFHPGGSLGRKLLTRVKDAMRCLELPCVKPTASVGESLITMTGGRLGLVLVMEGDELIGIVTDGDLRRAMQSYDDLLARSVREIMTANPVTVHEDTLFAEAQKRMTARKLKELVVVNEHGKVTGVVQVFDER